jgi:hypothetical protein
MSTVKIILAVLSVVAVVVFYGVQITVSARESVHARQCIEQPGTCR